MITADFAFDQGRQVLALPGPVTSSVTEGTSALIKRSAALVSSPSDILKAFNISIEDTEKASNKEVSNLTSQEELVFANLEKSNMSIDRLSREIQLPVGEVGQAISMLSLKGLVGQNSRGEYYLI